MGRPTEAGEYPDVHELYGEKADRLIRLNLFPHFKPATAPPSWLGQLASAMQATIHICNEAMLTKAKRDFSLERG